VAILIGMDEAGYGPNLGPLVVGASAWRLPGKPDNADLYRVLADAVVRPHDRSGADDRLVIGDSKAVYQPASGLGLLERGVLAALGSLGHEPRAWCQAWNCLAPDCAAELDGEPWHQSYNPPLPLAGDTDVMRNAARRLRAACDAGEVELVALRGRALFPAQFNGLVARWGNKATVLSRVTLALLAELLVGLPDEPVLALCDKHGGRNFYGPQLQQQFPDWLVECRGEGRAQSTYAIGPRECRHEVRFLTGGERELPVALASMVAKYLRELAMRAFNDFWQARVPQLKSTAGYPGDARRFKREIAAAQAELTLADDVLWRSR
jgi:hypothetical protein